MEKIILYGGSGLLGSAIIKYFPKKYKLIAPTHEELDITDKKKVALHIKTHQPIYIIYAVGLTRIDEAEQNPAKAKLLNVSVPSFIAKLTAQQSIPLIYFSSDAVFDNAKIDQACKETDTPKARSVYGKSKLAGEKKVLAASKKNLIVRVVMLYAAQHKKKEDFVRRIITLLKQNKSIQGVTDQFVTPVFVVTVVKALQKLIAARASGIYHVASTDVVTNDTFLQNIAQEFGLSSKLIKPITLKQFLNEKQIHRAHYASLDTTKFITQFGKTILQTTKQDLIDFHKAIRR